ncbi:MAG TPA: DUF1778 domain-containing protein [Acidimicrobiia bacterium]|jgi:hypothetical protein|nr:DUF1778 domain-containing protein [Acidimicrobiia bacterium]
MQISHLMVGLEQQVETQLRFADPEKLEMIGDVLEVINPAVRQTMFRVVETAVAEINSQLSGQNVEIRLADGDPELVVTAASTPPPPPPPDFPDSPDADVFDEARITLRIPGYLKEIISEAAKSAGDSVNSYVVDALRTAAPQTNPRKTVNQKIQL